MSPPRANYGWSRFLGDCAGGLIAALIALPYGLALASAMGLPPVLGIFTSILTAPIISLMGRNPVLIGGTASATVPFIALAARNHGIGGAARLSIMAAVILIGFGLVRLGRHIAKVPHAVVTGFSCGIGGMMLVSQLDIMFGVASPLTRSAGSGFGQLAAVLQHLPEVRAVPLILGLTVIVAATLSARVSRHAPAPLIGVGLAVLVGRFFGFHAKEVGSLSAMLPPLVGFQGSAGDHTVRHGAGLRFGGQHPDHVARGGTLPRPS
jgi:SulP family sulfate permease